jgi:hypothetical protein
MYYFRKREMVMIYEERKESKTLKLIIEIYNSNMDDYIPEIELNKKYKYMKYLYNSFGFDFIDAVIEKCVLYRIKNPYAFFKAVCEDYISQGIFIKDQIVIGTWRNKGRFNCTGRNYDYDSLERKLLGWE